MDTPDIQPQHDEKPVSEASADEPADSEAKPQPQQKQQPRPQPKTAEKPQHTSPAATPPATPAKKNATNSDKYEFKVQICTSSRNLRPDSEQFKGLKGTESFPVTVNGRQQYIHTYGSTTSYAAIKAVQTKIKDKFPDCFVVVFKDGQRINGDEANQAKKKQP